MNVSRVTFAAERNITSSFEPMKMPEKCNIQCLPSSPDFGTWSRSGPMSKKSPEKGPICLSSPEVHKCDFELCTDALVCMKRIGHSIFVIICMKSYQAESKKRSNGGTRKDWIGS